MRRIPVFEYYAFGYDYRRLRFDTEGVRIGEPGDQHSVRSLLDQFLATIAELDLRVTVQAAGKLREIALELEDKPANETVDEALARRIRDECTRIDSALDAELQLLGAYVVTPKRFAPEHLIDSPGELFARGVFGKLPVLCQYDFSEACRCIAFERPTAAAFHLMRGIEGTLRHYYESIVKRGRVKTPTWHSIVVQLRKRRDAPPDAILDHLDNIRSNFRNPTQHPDARYEIDEAQDLLAVSIDVVNRIHRDMKKRSN